MNDDAVVGFLDESSPQTTANTQRLWSFTKPTKADTSACAVFGYVAHTPCLINLS